MGLRYRKSIKIAPGIKLNINKNSIGLTAGVRGAHYTINSKGKRTATVGIPGTGLSYTSSTGGGTQQAEHLSNEEHAQVSFPSEKSKTLTLLLCIFFGMFGIHRFYVGKIGTGVIWFFTAGCCLFGWWYDIYAIATGKFTDKNGFIIQ